MMAPYVAVAAGGALGAVARYASMRVATSVFGIGFPYGTLLVNIVGSLLMGLAVGLFAKQLAVSEEMRLLVAVGFLGSYTTFSAFSLDVITLFQRGETLQVAFYIMGSVTLSVLALVAGMMLSRMM